jgi:Domain of unknown function (DUF4350)
MKERWVTLVCALGALALFLAMFLRGNDVGTRRGGVPSPTSEERRGNGYHGAMMWLDEAGVRTVSVRDRFDQWLAKHPGAAAETGNLLIVTLPVETAFGTEELRPLESWVRAGNTLLVMAALDDQPDWAFAVGRPVAGDLSVLTGLELEVARAGAQAVRPRGIAERGRASGDVGERVGAMGLERSASGDVGERIAAAARAFAEPRAITLVPNGAHAYFAGVSAAVGLSDYPAQAWAMKVPYDGFVLSLAHERATGQGALWTRAAGDGRIIVSGLGSLFTNRALGLADNAKLLADLIAVTVAPKGAVLFDDLHQGLSTAYDPAKLYSDGRLYATVAILAAVWLCWVLGSTQLQLPGSRVAAPREAELVQVTGSFLARVLTADAGALGLLEHFFRRIGRDQGAPPWELLEGHAGVTVAEVRQLQRWYADAKAARAVPLLPLHNLIVKIDRQWVA